MLSNIVTFKPRFWLMWPKKFFLNKFRLNLPTALTSLKKP